MKIEAKWLGACAAGASTSPYGRGKEPHCFGGAPRIFCISSKFLVTPRFAADQNVGRVVFDPAGAEQIARPCAGHPRL
jgi:hypothetical protein